MTARVRPQPSTITAGPRGQRPRRRGITLIELIFVLAISAVLLSVGIIRLGRLSVFMAEGERAARRLAADLRLAQSEAITAAKNHYILFADHGTKYTSYAIFRAEDGDDVQIEPTRTLSGGVAVTGSAARAEFTPGGDALAAYTYTVTSPGREYQITVILATGAVTLSDVG